MSKYAKIIQHVFEENYDPHLQRIPFSRQDLIDACSRLGFKPIKNVGDIPYSFRFRRALPEAIIQTAPDDAEWIIVGSGIAEYEFRLASPGKISARTDNLPIKVPDATPEIVRLYAAGTDEQALLTRVRYNRLIDLFLGLTCYSIQNHLRTTVTGIGQIEVDEIYLGVNKRGTHFVIPAQAKSPGDSFGITQVMQDMALCQERYPLAICRPIALQFIDESSVAVVELLVTEEDDLLNLHVVDEKLYRLVHRSELSDDELKRLMDTEDFR